ncbi:MAG: hypothetical protein ABSE59_03670 [Opitutaceae bacterium]|jgi:hypothetical protein
MKSPELLPEAERFYYDFVGRFLSLEPVRRIIAQELYFDRLRPFVETADLLEHEPEQLDEWKRQRPETSRWAEAGARRALQAFELNSGSPPEDNDRWLLRMSALRRLDAWLAPGGDLMIERPPILGGDLYWAVAIPGFDHPMKVGLNDTRDYPSDPRHEAEFKAVLEKESAIAAVEFALFPLAGHKGLFLPNHWRRIRARWREVAALRDFDAGSDVAVFPEGYLFTKPRAGMVARVPPEFLGQINPLLFLETGLCPWLPGVTAAFLQGHQHEFAARATEDQIRAWIGRMLVNGWPENPANIRRERPNI